MSERKLAKTVISKRSEKSCSVINIEIKDFSPDKSGFEMTKKRFFVQTLIKMVLDAG